MLFVQSCQFSLNSQRSRMLCYVYTMFPAATAAPFARNVVRRGIFGHFFLSFHVLLSFLTVYHGIRDGSWGYGLLSPGGSKARYGSACGLPRMPVRSLPVRHVLIGSLTFLTFWSWSDTLFTFCQGFSTYETWTPGSFGERLCPQYEEKASQAGFCWRKSMMSSFSSSKKLVTTLGLPFS